MLGFHSSSVVEKGHEVWVEDALRQEFDMSRCSISSGNSRVHLLLQITCGRSEEAWREKKTEQIKQTKANDGIVTE